MATFCRVVFLGLLSGIAWAQSQLSIRGYFFGDYFYKAGGDSTGGRAQYAAYKRGDHAFQFRRFYLWVDAQLGPRCSSRLLLESNDVSLDGRRRYTVFVKEASVRWDSLGLPFLQLRGGIIPTPTWHLSEQIWGYRSLERTVTDFWGWGNSTDFGVALCTRIPLGKNTALQSTLMVGSGDGVRLETDRYKKLYGQLALQPFRGAWIELYGDWEARPAEQTVSLLKLFLGYRRPTFQAGAEFLLRSHRNFPTQGQTSSSLGMSFSGNIQLVGEPSLRLVARYDRVDEDRHARIEGFIYHFALLGLDYAPVPQVHLMPNVWILAYTAKEQTPRRKTDVVPRLSFFILYP